MTGSPSTCLLVTCHPEPNSLCGQIAERAIAALAARNTTAVVNDLYRLNFNPVTSGHEFSSYPSGGIPEDIRRLVTDLQSAHELIFILPIWMFAIPAMLKGYFDRVWRPDVAFTFDGQNLQPLLRSITRMTVIVTHGRSEAETNATGDGSRVFFESSLPALLPNLASNERFDFYALDDGDSGAVTRQLNQLMDFISQGYKA
ncbi:NAD(P)H-dependent oxidoreductase [Hyphomicrobium sp. ghe19]|uniref:NAD(P)H-dependent oxidoreductase n=1 Tax=Hyphomicrobium sp. ghe19 TaxID=2682968 RepID=UPI001366EA6C|nr:FMN-dependent NADH-azoreductase [Hyphomicrobium sp. ghe19]